MGGCLQARRAGCQRSGPTLPAYLQLTNERRGCLNLLEVECSYLPVSASLS